MLREEMWKIFEATGNINSYLYYSDCKKCKNTLINKYENEAICISKNERILQGL